MNFPLFFRISPYLLIFCEKKLTRNLPFKVDFLQFQQSIVTGIGPIAGLADIHEVDILLLYCWSNHWLSNHRFLLLNWSLSWFLGSLNLDRFLLLWLLLNWSNFWLILRDYSGHCFDWLDLNVILKYFHSISLVSKFWGILWLF